MAHRGAINDRLIKFSQLARTPQDQSEFGKFRGLHGEIGKVNPVGISIDGQFDSWDERQAERQE